MNLFYSIKLYLMIIYKEAQRFFTYRANIFAGLISAVLILAARFALWHSLFATGNAQVATFEDTMTFFVINDILILWIAASYSNYIGPDVASGDIVYRLMKPASYHLQLIALSHARAFISTITRSLPMFIFAVIFIDLIFPTVIVFMAFLLVAILGGIIYSLLDLIISYTVFWLTEYWYVSWFKRAIFALFGGLALPLWFYPEWLRSISELLPFQFAIFVPVELYLGRIPVSDIGAILLIQLFWIAVLFLCERLIWKWAQRKLIIQGG